MTWKFPRNKPGGANYDGFGIDPLRLPVPMTRSDDGAVGRSG